MGGRIDDIAVSETDPNIIYLGYAVGGVWKSENNGMTFEPVFDTYSVGVDRRHRHPSAQSEHRLRRHRRAEQPPDLVVRRRHLQDDRRRQDVHAHRPEGDADDRAHRHRSEESRDGLRRGARAICSGRIPSAASTRRPTAARPGTRSSSSTTTRASPTSRSIRSNTNILYAASYQRRRTRLLLQRRRARQRDLEEHRRRQDVEQADGQRAAAGHLRPHRARRLALESERRLRADRSG